MSEPSLIRRRIWHLFVALCIAFAVWVTIVIGLAAHIHHVGTIDNAQESDTIIVLGAGLLRGGRPGPAMYRRVQLGAELWHAGYAEHIICTGGLGNRQPRTEADACRDLLLENGVPESAIYLEETSTSTEENAIYSREIMDAQGWQTALVVSDAYHIFRADLLFRKWGIDAVFSPVPANEIRGRPSYPYQIVRELLALHWQAFKDVLNLPYTNSPL